MPIVRITRRGALALGGGAAAAGVAGALGLGSARTPQSRLTASSKVLSQHGSLPAVEIERIVEADGLMSDGVLTINVKRDDIGTVEGPLGIVFTGSFGLVGTLCFQPLGMISRSSAEISPSGRGRPTGSSTRSSRTA